QEIPREKPIPAPKHTAEKLCNVYTLTDCHVGALAWHREGGQDWDLQIAEKTLVGCFAQMVESAPSARIGFVNQLGDFLHSDGIMPVTPTSGHVLDQDGRFSKVVQVAVRVLRQVVGMALAKHEKVVVLLAEGNHDISSSIWLRTMFKALYENEPRIEVIDSVLPYYVYEHGKTMLGFHHGHLKKNDGLPLLFASQFPKVWGVTEKRYCHVGHRHHVEEKEHSGITVIQHPTLAARDAYAARGGWLNERQVTAITYHADFGQVARVTVTPEMLG
ncbi:MAG: winged helix-turn-helix domain-containing protein, partial [Patescibacteria group bacterium]|nr:winged helix-turn-helix domain-containing protein [Patescibacteria group bacterium]